MRRGTVTTGAAPPADTGPPLTMECPLPCAVLACSKAGDGTGAGRNTHPATYDVKFKADSEAFLAISHVPIPSYTRSKVPHS